MEAESASSPKRSMPADLLALQADCSNWERWGKTDEVGAPNLITAQHIIRAAAEITTGEVVSLCLPLDDTGPQTGGRRFNPRLQMIATGTDHLHGSQRSSTGAELTGGFGVGDDVIEMPNQAGTHVDALSHVFHAGKMYNGFSAGDVTAAGAAHCGIQHLSARLVARGVLLDVARYLETDVLEPGTAIDAGLLDATAQAQGSSVGPGDAVLVRTGFLGARRSAWRDYCGGDAPGLGLDSARWLHSNEVAFVGSDTWGVEVRPNEVDVFQPLHLISLVHGGIPFGENFVLDELSERCRSRNQWSFLLAVAPLPITGACGSPVNPLAIL